MPCYLVTRFFLSPQFCDSLHSIYNTVKPRLVTSYLYITCWHENEYQDDACIFNAFYDLFSTAYRHLIIIHNLGEWDTILSNSMRIHNLHISLLIFVTWEFCFYHFIFMTHRLPLWWRETSFTRTFKQRTQMMPCYCQFYEIYNKSKEYIGIMNSNFKQVVLLLIFLSHKNLVM